MAALLAAGSARSLPLADETRLLELVNAEREAHGLTPLHWDATLGELAQAHAFDMHARGVASHHSSRDGAGFAERLDRSGLPVLEFSENVALAGSLLGAHLHIMGDADMRASVLHPRLTHVGMGVAQTDDGLAVFVVQDFAAVLPELSLDEARGAVGQALRGVPRALSGPPLREAPELSREATRLARLMAAAGTVQAPGSPGLRHDVAFFYDSRDPAQLPDDVDEVARRALDFGMGVARAEEPDRREATFWIAVIFRDVS